MPLVFSTPRARPLKTIPMWCDIASAHVTGRGVNVEFATVLCPFQQLSCKDVRLKFKKVRHAAGYYNATPCLIKHCAKFQACNRPGCHHTPT